MQFHITSAKLTGNPGEAGWAQIHDFTPEDEEKLEKRGHLIAVVSTSKKNEGEETVVAGREIIARLHEEYYGQMELSTFNALKKAVEKVIEEFKEGWGDIEIAAASFVNGTVYSAAGGGGEVSIFRQGMLATILKSKSGEVIAASGHPEAGDILLLGSSSFYKTVQAGVLKASLETGSPEDIAESFGPTVHAKADLGALGLAVIKFDEIVNVEKLAVEKEEPQRSLEIKKPVFQPRAGGFFARIKETLKDKIPDRRLYVKKGETDVEDVEKRKMAVTIGGILLFLLLVSIFFGIRQRRINEEKSKYETKITEARHDLDEAKSLYSLNPDRARELFASSLTIVNDLESQGVKNDQLTALKSELEKGRQDVLGEYDTSLSEFVDLSLIDGFSGKEIVGSGNTAYVLDSAKNRIIKVSLDSKKTQVIAGPSQIENPSQIAAYQDRVFDVEDGNIYEVGDSKKDTVQKDWSGSILVYSYAANLYVLDKKASKIYRYPGTDSGFGSKSEWLAPGINPDFSNVISMSIDGSIWILTSTGKIEKYTYGSPQNLGTFSISPALSNPVEIYTNESLGNVYLLDPGSERVVVFDKDGNYKAQYKSSDLKDAKGIVADESLGKIFVLTSAKLFTIDIK